MTANWLMPNDSDVLGAFLNRKLENACPTIIRIEFAFDQWVRCRIRCEHRTVTATSVLVNFTEAFVRAQRLFLSSEHKLDEEGDPVEDMDNQEKVK